MLDRLAEDNRNRRQEKAANGRRRAGGRLPLLWRDAQAWLVRFSWIFGSWGSKLAAIIISSRGEPLTPYCSVLPL